MTSMPASRNARAITLAPRSWPSRPGLATSTRILGSAIATHLTTEGTGITEASLSSLSSRANLWLKRLDIRASPQIPAGHTAVGFPTFGDLLHDVRLGQFALAVMFLDRRLNPVIARGQDVLALQREHQEHLRRPHADAFDLRQVLDDLFIRQFRQFRKIQQTFLRLRRQI